MSGLIVRPAARADYDRWLPLWDGYNAFYGRSGTTAPMRGFWTDFRPPRTPNSGARI